MRITLRIPKTIIDLDKGILEQLPAGTYELEEMTNPYGGNRPPWWVVKGTRKGLHAPGWQQEV